MAKMARIAFLKAPGCVNRDENGQKVVGRVLARCAPGSQVRFDGWARAGPGARRGWLGVRPEGVCWEPDAPPGYSPGSRVRAGDGRACVRRASAGSQTHRGLGARQARAREPGSLRGVGVRWGVGRTPLGGGVLSGKLSARRGAGCALGCVGGGWACARRASAGSQTRWGVSGSYGQIGREGRQTAHPHARVPSAPACRWVGRAVRP